MRMLAPPRALAILAVLSGLVAFGRCFGPRSDNSGHQRIYFQTWNVGEVCGSNAEPGCREAAIKYLSSTSVGAEFNIATLFGLLSDAGQPVDLTQYGVYKGKNYTQFGSVCSASAGSTAPPSTVSITLGPGFQLLGKGAGCLVGNDATAVTAGAPKPFAVALVKPPPVHGLVGGEVKGCPNGFCLVAINAPYGPAHLSAGADTLADVCGDTRHLCTVAVGDFNLSPQQTYDQRWAELIDKLPGAAPTLYKTGSLPHGVAVTNLAAGGAMNVGEGYPLTPRWGQNVTGMRPAQIIDLLLPCQHPGPFARDGCTA